ncbi:synaptotagmin-like protein 3 [Chelonoidis abingdonii]|uniref:synaptotagmin-like protein 3 n=1 Tax=Chelonoidis abingdonii TaxID=106734 RepID=UPI0013F22EAE|nr:synaptotagmin-like protein 3 isoform X1 [Chelonoidis abingdonii]XP_032649173.1 synaptotagmin-like protein 3 isoform X1 [Chelonoidis abingdonii]
MTCELNLNFLKELEQETVLQVLYRDQMVRKVDEERIRKLKMQLQQLQWKGTNSVSHEYQERSCARCQKSLGLVMNRGAVCNGCSHRVCSECRVCLNPYLWKCTICYAHGDMKVKTGEWFFEERAKKFPAEGRHETAGAKLLKSYQKLSKISVVPPTPPPFTETTGRNTTMEISQSKSFNKSVENLFLSLATNMKKISKSQNDMRADKSLLTTDYGQDMERKKERRSQSDTAIDVANRIKNIPTLQQLISGTRDDNEAFTKRYCKQAEDIPTSPMSDAIFCSGKKHGSLYSINSTCTEAGNFDTANVTGEIEFAIRYVFKACTLEVCIKACKNLAYGEEKKKKCNPYAKTYLLPDKSSRSKRKTAVRKNTVDPAFHETLKYKIEYSQLETRQLQISVWHSETLKRRVFLGEVIVPLASWNFEDNSTQLFNWYQLKVKSGKPEDNLVQYNGELLVCAKLILPSQSKKCQYEEQMRRGREDQASAAGQLHLVVLGAKNLPVMRCGGTLNSFVKGCLTLPDQREIRQKSPVLKKEACPQWKHLFVFDGVTPSQLRQSFLDLAVWDQASFGSNDRFLGGARLSTKEPSGTWDSDPQSKHQWQKILSSPNTWIDITLTLHSDTDT